MKILVASDIHGCFTAFEKLITIFENEKCGLLILCGDYLNHGPRNAIPDGYDTKKTAALLNQYKSKILSVRGNCDSEVDQMMLEFPVRSESAQLVISGSESWGKAEFSMNGKPSGRIFVHHGHLFTEEQIKTLLPQGTLIISGHTHVPVLKYEDGYIFMNPSSISIPKTDDGPCYGMIEANSAGINRVSIFKMDGSGLQYLEWSDLYRSDGTALGKTKLRQSDEIPGALHLVSEIVTVDKHNNILVTKRAAEKDTFPGFWEITGGSCLSGETETSGAVREIREETGISVSESNLVHVQSAVTEHALCNLYINKIPLGKDDIKITLQKGETEEYKWLSKKEFETLFNSENFCPAIQKRYTAKEILAKID